MEKTERLQVQLGTYKAFHKKAACAPARNREHLCFITGTEHQCFSLKQRVNPVWRSLAIKKKWNNAS